MEACKSNAYSDHVAHRGADMMIDVPKHMFPWDLYVPKHMGSDLLRSRDTGMMVESFLLTFV